MVPEVLANRWRSGFMLQVFARHVIADVGGWTLASRDAMDGYHETDPEMILKVKSDIPWALEMS